MKPYRDPAPAGVTLLPPRPPPDRQWLRDVGRIAFLLAVFVLGPLAWLAYALWCAAGPAPPPRRG